MSEHKIEMTGPVPCPKCGDGLMLAFARPHFKAGEKTDKQFSHYENYYRCSRCGYEMRERKGKGSTNTMKEGEDELDQDEGDDDGEDGDEVDSWQRRRNLK
jgi:ribosomal protein S27AE